LLHAIRCIGQFEDSLCELSHEVRQSGEMSPEGISELRTILENIPGHDYVQDLDAVRIALGELRRPAKASAKTSSKSAPASKRSALAAKA
jgi:hypothetical protein